MFRFRFRCSRRFNPGVLITSSQLQSCSRGPVVFIWCQSPGCSLYKRIYSLGWAYRKENHKYDHIYTTNKSSLVQYISKMRGQVHNCPFENIWFAISQPLCIMYVSSIHTVECRYNAIQCYKIFHTALRGLKHDIQQGSKSHIIPNISPQWASFGMTCARIKMKIYRVITAPHCIVTNCKLVMFHAYDQVAVHVYLYWTQDTIEDISFARNLLVTVNTVSSPAYSVCFEIKIWLLNLPQSMFQVVFRQGIFNLQ